MFLAIDIGNSNIKTAIFNGNKIEHLFRFPTIKEAGVDYYFNILKDKLKEYPIDKCGIISVVENLDSVIKTAIDNIFNIESLMLTPYSCMSIKIESEKRKFVGMDRLANIYAACDYSLPAIVVDIGTAITFDIISKDKAFLGGAIMPGINMQLSALHTQTSKLPLIKAGKSEIAIGNTTESAILAGVIRGIAAAIDGLISQSAAELGEEAVIIVTGGQYKILTEYIKTRVDFYEPDLTLFGIKRIFDKQK